MLKKAVLVENWTFRAVMAAVFAALQVICRWCARVNRISNLSVHRGRRRFLTSFPPQHAPVVLGCQGICRDVVAGLVQLSKTGEIGYRRANAFPSPGA